MTTTHPPVEQRPSRSVLPAVAGTILFLLVAVAGLLWAKWWPYAHKLQGLRITHVWPGGSILDTSGAPGSAPSWSGAWNFTVAYGNSVWKALAVALIVAAGVDALLPRQWLLRVTSGRGRFRGSLAGGLLSLPGMMCTCCTAPVAVSFRRSGVPTSSALAYWVGNPALNPAVLAFLAIIAPWQWGVVRALVGIVLVFVLTSVVAKLADKPAPAGSVPAQEVGAFRLRDVPGRFLRSLTKLVVILIPEYFIVVLGIGALSGWLSSFGSFDARWGVAALLVAAVVGTLLVIPTGGEIPIVMGLAAAGVGAGSLGALLITLPAVSLPSIVMVARALSWRVTMAMAGAVAVSGVAAGALLWALTAA